MDARNAPRRQRRGAHLAGDTKTIRALLAATKPWLEKRGVDSARLDAELLLAHVLRATRLELYMDMDRPLTDAEVDRYRELVKRRGAREPAAYLVGEKEFFGLSMKVTKDVLVPRPDTETVVEECLRLVAPDVDGVLVDACTGTGCIAVAILHARPRLRAVATDVSPAAAAIARENAANNGVADRLDVRIGDLLAPCADVAGALLVVANPPYIAAGERDDLMPEVRDHEPALALFGDDDDALGHHRRLLAQARALLAPGAPLVLEIGAAQGEAARSLAHDGYDEARVVDDLAGRPRAVVWRRAG